MKKLLLCLVLIFGLFACGGHETAINEITIESYDVDMSGYKGVNSTNHNFKGISPDEVIRLIDEGGSAVIYMGYEGCHVCQEAVQYLNEVAQNLGVTVYYLDCNSPIYPVRDEVFTNLVTALDSILETNDAGEKTIFTPHVFTIVNGELNKGHISVVSSWEEGNPSEESIKELEDIYADIMAPFAK